jgi:hypothetical protein
VFLSFVVINIRVQALYKLGKPGFFPDFLYLTQICIFVIDTHTFLWHFLLSPAKVLLMVNKQTKEQDKPQDPRFEKLKDVTLIICTPCYGGVVTEAYAQGMFTLAGIASQYGIGVGYATIANESLVTRARNELVHAFLQNTKATHMMFIDADIKFDPKSIVRMLLADQDVVVGAYPLKTLNWESVVDKARYSDMAAQDAAKEAAMYVINVHKPDPEMVGKQVDVQIKNGLLEVYDAGTGFMLMKRHVLEKMIENYPDTMYYSDKDMTEDLEKRKRYALFDTMIDSDKRYLSEDYTFCRRWQELDGKIYLDVNTTLSHIGTYTFVGNGLVKPK